LKDETVVEAQGVMEGDLHRGLLTMVVVAAATAEVVAAGAGAVVMVMAASCTLVIWHFLRKARIFGSTLGRFLKVI
jgi:hypothetical protein